MRLDILRGVVKENVDGPKRTEEFKEGSFSAFLAIVEDSKDKKLLMFNFDTLNNKFGKHQSDL